MTTSEFGEGLVIRLKSPGQPDKRQIMMQGPFQLARTADSVGVAIDEHLEHNPRIVLGTAYLVGSALYPKQLHIQGIHEGVIGSDGVF